MTFWIISRLTVGSSPYPARMSSRVEREKGESIVIATIPRAASFAASSRKSTRVPPEPCMKITPGLPGRVNPGCATRPVTRPPPGLAKDMPVTSNWRSVTVSPSETASGFERVVSNAAAASPSTGSSFPDSAAPPQPASRPSVTSRSVASRRIAW